MAIEDLGRQLMKQGIEKDLQPVLTNSHLEDLKDAQPPKWVHFLILILAALAAGVAIITLLLQLKVF